MSSRLGMGWITWLSALCAVAALRAERGVTPTEIELGQSAAFTGPASALGIGMRDGLLAAFAEINASGGVNGRAIRLVSKDDGYEPDRAQANTRDLIEKENVFSLIGAVGTPTTLASLPVCEEGSVPFLTPFTGAIRASQNPMIVHLRASYDQEVESLVHFLVDGRKLKRIACLRQDDGYGLFGFNALKAALGRRHLPVAAVGPYERNTSNVGGALRLIQEADPDAILMVGTYAACAKFVAEGRRQGMANAVYCTISFVGTRALLNALEPADSEGLIISQVVPDPAHSTLPVASAYIAALKAYNPALSPDWISFEGYLAGRLFADLARRAGSDLTRASLMASTYSPDPIDLGGFSLQFGRNRRQGSDAVYLTRVHGGQVENLL